MPQTMSVAQELAGWAAVIGIFLLAYQIHLQIKYQRNQAVAKLFDDMVTPEFQKKLRFVYSRTPEDLILSKLDESQREIVDEITARFEALGFRIRKKVVPKKESIEIFWDWVIRCAQQLRLYIKDQRRRRGPSDFYRNDFDWLARECKLFHLERLGHKVSTMDMELDELLKVKPLSFFNIEIPRD